MDDRRYFSRAWALLTRDKGWIKPVLAMTAATLVPVAGPLGNRGYALEWARLTAWGVDASPKQKNVNVGACISSGLRGFLVNLGWGAALSIAVGMLATLASAFPGDFGDVLVALVRLVGVVVGIFWGCYTLVCQVRAAIYESAAAGYRPDRVLDMIRSDVEGFLKVVLVSFVCDAVVVVITAIMAVLLVIELVPAIMLAQDAYTVSEFFNSLSGSFVAVGLTCAVFGSILALAGTLTLLLTTQAAALWMRQFDVPSWGRSEDPLPQRR